MIVRLDDSSVSAIAAPIEAPQAYYWDRDLRGFGLVVGKTGRKTFVARRRVDGRVVKRTIGVAGTPRGDGHTWTVQLARIAARELLTSMVDEGAAIMRSREELGRQLKRLNGSHEATRRLAQAVADAEQGLVYFMQDESEGSVNLNRIKIGWTGRPIAKRLSHLRRDRELFVLAIVPFVGREQERTLHDRFSHLRVRGEWFEPSWELLEYIRALRDGAEQVRRAA